MQLTRRALLGAALAAVAAPNVAPDPVPAFVPALELELPLVGDGVTDCTAALQAMLDRGQGIVGLEGTYRVTAPLAFPIGGGRVVGTSFVIDHGSAFFTTPLTKDGSPPPCAVMYCTFETPPQWRSVAARRPFMALSTAP